MWLREKLGELYLKQALSAPRTAGPSASTGNSGRSTRRTGTAAAICSPHTLSSAFPSRRRPGSPAPASSPASSRSESQFSLTTNPAKDIRNVQIMRRTGTQAPQMFSSYHAHSQQSSLQRQCHVQEYHESIRALKEQVMLKVHCRNMNFCVCVSCMCESMVQVHLQSAPSKVT